MARKAPAKRPKAKSPTSRKQAGRATERRSDTGAKLRVRMYRQGLGDCFLISLLHPPAKDFHLMIDCGVILGTKDAGEVISSTAY